jgi:hypothetical protein
MTLQEAKSIARHFELTLQGAVCQYRVNLSTVYNVLDLEDAVTPPWRWPVSASCELDLGRGSGIPGT